MSSIPAGTITSRGVRRTYYALTTGNTLAASLIWGINTIFLLDAGLSNVAAFTANACFTAGMVLFEIPTGVIADSRGRRVSFLLGTVTLAITTVLYVVLWQLRASFGWWAVVSALLGLGFTFFSGATEAWLVDALAATRYPGQLESVFARGQTLSGAMMLIGSAAGGYLAQVTNLGVPYLVRGVILLGMFVLALALMHDLGFTPRRGAGPVKEMRTLLQDSVRYGLKVPAIRATMLAGAFSGGIGIYVFYALQPYLLELWGDPTAYGIAGLAAAIVAGAQILGGLITPWVRRRFQRRTSALIAMQVVGVLGMVLIGLIADFWAVLAVFVVWSVGFSTARPIRQAYLNGMIPSRQRATILSFDSMINSSGGIVAQPVLGRVADVWSYQLSYLVSGVAASLALPFLAKARRAGAAADREDSVPPASADQVDP